MGGEVGAMQDRLPRGEVQVRGEGIGEGGGYATPPVPYHLCPVL